MIVFDCHAHVFETVPRVCAVRYLPTAPAPLDAWLGLLERHGIVGGVLVQVSFLGDDNSQLLSALDRLDRRRFAGVAVLGHEHNEAELARLTERGIKALRWNLVAGAPIPNPASPAVRRHLDRLRDFGMHLEIQLESGRLAAVLPDLLKAAGTLVVDHMGLPCAPRAEDEPWLKTLEKMRDRDGLHVKLSAPYRSAYDPRENVDRLLDLLPGNRFIWGSDWPHTQHESRASYSGLRDEIADRIDEASAILHLYGLQVPDN